MIKNKKNVEETVKWISIKLSDPSTSKEDKEYLYELKALLGSLSDIGMKDDSVCLIPLKLWQLAYDSFNK